MLQNLGMQQKLGLKHKRRNPAFFYGSSGGSSVPQSHNGSKSDEPDTHYVPIFSLFIRHLLELL